MEAAKTNEAVRETMTTGAAAFRLGMSVASVRRRLDRGELDGYFTGPAMAHRDVRGHELRGHRRVFVYSVEAYEKKLRKAIQEGIPRNS